jgi:carbon-monoxide dehydrogenase iron sulfur subunit
VVKIVIDYAKCSKDSAVLCLEICPLSLFKIDKSGRPKIVDEDKCIGCRICQVNCPSQAIQILT